MGTKYSDFLDGLLMTNWFSATRPTRRYRRIFYKDSVWTRTGRGRSNKDGRPVERPGSHRVSTPCLINWNTNVTLGSLMGLTGAGKSSVSETIMEVSFTYDCLQFIGMATGYEDGIGHQLQSYTHDVNLIKFKCHERNNVNLVFVDTPALDHTHKSYSDVLEIIAQWLKKLWVTSSDRRGSALTVDLLIAESAKSF